METAQALVKAQIDQVNVAKPKSLNAAEIKALATNSPTVGKLVAQAYETAGGAAIEDSQPE